MYKLSYMSKRVIAGCLLLVVVVCLVNYYADLKWFGRYDKEAIAIGATLLFVHIAYIGPSIREMEERREKKSRKDDSARM